MKKALAIALSAIGAVLGTVATTGCIMVIFDEPEMPRSLIDWLFKKFSRIWELLFYFL